MIKSIGVNDRIYGLKIVNTTQKVVNIRLSNVTFKPPNYAFAPNSTIV
jgi:hypothetical protein